MAAASPAMDRVRRNSRSEQPPTLHTQQPTHGKREVEMPPQHQFEGEDADITGHETIRDEEDEDHYVYPDAHPQTVSLVMGVQSDVSHPHVERDAVMATQGSVVLPSKSVDGGLQFVDVDRSAGRLPAATVPSSAYPVAADKDVLMSDKPVSGEKDEFDRSSGGAVEGSEEILHIPSDALASVKNANLRPTTVPSSTTANNNNNSGSQDGIEYFRSDPCKVVLVQQQSASNTAATGDSTVMAGSEEILHIPADALASVKHANLSTELPRSVSAVEGSDDILNIPSDALASVKHGNMTTAQRPSVMDGGEVAWSERNVESHIVPQTPTAAVSQLFDLASPADEQQQQQQQRSLNIVV